MQNDEIIKNIEALYKQILDKINKKIENLSDKTQKNKIYVPDLSRLNYNKGEITGFWIPKEIIKESKLITIGINSEYLKEFSNYQDLITLIGKTSQKNETEIIISVERLFQKLINESYGEYNKDLLEKYSNYLIKELEGEPPFFHIKIFFFGIWLEEEEIKIDDNLKFRKVKPEDFQFNSINLLRVELGNLGDLPLTILKLKFQSKLKIEDYNSVEAQVELQEELNSLDYALLLFRLGSVFSLRTEIKPKSFLTPSGLNVMRPYIKINSSYFYHLKENDCSKLMQLIVRFRAPEVRDLISFRRRDYNYINIAYQRYQNAFINVENLESQISYAISCLEALFSMKGIDLTRKLCQRVSIIFKILGFSSLSIYRVIKEAYKIRSDYSHGNVKKIGDPVIYHSQIKNLARGVLQCARISLLIFIQVDHLLKNKKIIVDITKNKDLNRKAIGTIVKMRKELFISVMDNALIDDKSYLRLNKFIDENCAIYP